MGYTFKIGNATPNNDKTCFPELYAQWEVEGIFLKEAPSFPNDFHDQSNIREPSYTVWSNFCKHVGLYELFYDDYGHLEARHPGCVGITPEDVELVASALHNYKQQAILPPGFEEDFCYEGPPNYDYDLARLMWLEWWMRWAVENCETPAIQNY